MVSSRDSYGISKLPKIAVFRVSLEIPLLSLVSSDEYYAVRMLEQRRPILQTSVTKNFWS